MSVQAATDFVTLAVTFSVFLTTFLPDLSSLSTFYGHSQKYFFGAFLRRLFRLKGKRKLSRVDQAFDKLRANAGRSRHTL